MDYFLFNFSGVQFHYTMSPAIIIAKFGNSGAVIDVSEVRLKYKKADNRAMLSIRVPMRTAKGIDFKYSITSLV